MGKRRRNPRMVLPSAAGPENHRFCFDHNELVKPVKVFGHGFKFVCKEGCSLDKHQTDLKTKTTSKRTR